MKPSSPDQDKKQDIATRKLIKLYQCSDEDGTLKIREVKGGPLEQSDLLSKDSFIVDNGSFGIWVWVGKKASPKERTEAMRNAQGEQVTNRAGWRLASSHRLILPRSFIEERVNQTRRQP